MNSGDETATLQRAYTRMTILMMKSPDTQITVIVIDYISYIFRPNLAPWLSGSMKAHVKALAVPKAKVQMPALCFCFHVGANGRENNTVCS
jgi:hypothetical protein